MIGKNKKGQVTVSNPKEIKNKAWAPAEFTLPEAYAIQALEAGIATEEQQRLAIQFIVNNLCGTYDQQYMTDSQRDTDFALGKRHVGLQLVRLIKTNLSIYKSPNDE